MRAAPCLGSCAEGAGRRREPRRGRGKRGKKKGGGGFNKWQVFLYLFSDFVFDVLCFEFFRSVRFVLVVLCSEFFPFFEVCARCSVFGVLGLGSEIGLDFRGH